MALQFKTENIGQFLTRLLYSFLLIMAVPFAYAGLLKRGVRKHRHDSQHFLSRFGCVAKPEKSGGYFFHCVSVGEVVAASCVIKQVLASDPDATITVTTTTPTGSARVRAIFDKRVHHFYLPFDFSFAMRWMLNRIKPSVVCITEVELWPNLIHECWKKQIPTLVINARMTDRSAKRYAKISALFSPMLIKLGHVCAQGQRDYDNYLALGIAKSKLTLTNNIKFDQAASLQTNSDADFMSLSDSGRYIIVAGSTHAPEEQVLLDAFYQLNKADNAANALLIIVPRHPERFDDVAQLLRANNVTFLRSSASNQISEETQVVLLDEMGRLNDAYATAHVAFVGGSLADRGGHNALEPAAFGIPILMGPDTYNNPVICDHLISYGGLFIVNSADEIAEHLGNWLCDPKAAQNAGRAAKAVLTDNRGALTKTLQVLDEYKQAG